MPNPASSAGLLSPPGLRSFCPKTTWPRPRPQLRPARGGRWARPPPWPSSPRVNQLPHGPKHAGMFAALAAVALRPVGGAAGAIAGEQPILLAVRPDVPHLAEVVFGPVAVLLDLPGPGAVPVHRR